MTNQTFQFNLTQPEADVIIQVLAEQPYKVSGQLIPKLQKQFQEQAKAEAEPVEPVKEK